MARVQSQLILKLSSEEIKKNNRNNMKKEEKKNILIIDDDQDARAMYSQLFRKAGYKVQTAIDGLEGLELAQKQHPDVIFTGIIMPRMDGFAMVRALAEHEQTSEIPVVMNSHLGRSEDRKQADALDVKDFIVRGMVSPQEVIERIGALVSDTEEFLIEPDIYARDAAKLAKEMGLMGNALQCSNGERVVMRITITDKKRRTGTVRFDCE